MHNDNIWGNFGQNRDIWPRGEHILNYMGQIYKITPKMDYFTSQIFCGYFKLSNDPKYLHNTNNLGHFGQNRDIWPHGYHIFI
jgi:hypothetical protein